LYRAAFKVQPIGENLKFEAFIDFFAYPGFKGECLIYLSGIDADKTYRG
jgi:hypothetical protein